MSRRTKIVATLGPACDGPEVLRGLIDAGVDVVRLNLSHGAIDEHLGRLARVRSVAAEAGRAVAVLADLPGPKIRTGHFPDGGVELVAGSLLVLRPGDGPSDAGLIQIPYDTLLHDLSVGSRVQLGDGAISMTVVDIEERGRGRGSRRVATPTVSPACTCRRRRFASPHRRRRISSSPS